MARFLFPILIFCFSISAFAKDEEEDSHCSDWLLNASEQGYEAAFDQWKAKTDRAQEFIAAAKLAEAAHSSPFSREQLKAARLLSGWYSALIHLGTLAPIETISSTKKIKALKHAAGDEFEEGMAIHYPLPRLNTITLPQHVREFYDWLTYAVESGFPTGAVKDYLAELAKLNESGS